MLPETKVVELAVGLPAAPNESVGVLASTVNNEVRNDVPGSAVAKVNVDVVVALKLEVA